MHYSPHDLQLGAEVQAKIDATAAGQKFSFAVGEPMPSQQAQGNYFLLGLLALGVLVFLSRPR